jgi:hypothetical protein
MTGIPLGGLQYFKKTSAFVPSGQVFVVAIGKDGKGCKGDEEPCLYAVVTREQISDMAALDSISQFIQTKAEIRYEKECASFWLDHYGREYPDQPDEALGRAGADE